MRTWCRRATRRGTSEAHRSIGWWINQISVAQPIGQMIGGLRYCPIQNPHIHGFPSVVKWGCVLLFDRCTLIERIEFKGLLGKFFVSESQQSQEFHVVNVHNDGSHFHWHFHANLRRIIKEGVQDFPIVFPAFFAGGIIRVYCQSRKVSIKRFISAESIPPFKESFDTIKFSPSMIPCFL